MTQSSSLVSGVGVAASAGVGGVTTVLAVGSGHNSVVAVTQSSSQLSAADGADLSVGAISSSAGGVTGSGDGLGVSTQTAIASVLDVTIVHAVSINAILLHNVAGVQLLHHDVIELTISLSSATHQGDQDSGVGAGVEGDLGLSPVVAVGNALVNDVGGVAVILNQQVHVLHVLRPQGDLIVGVSLDSDTGLTQVLPLAGNQVQSEVVVLTTLDDLNGGAGTPQVVPGGHRTGLEVTVLDVTVIGLGLSLEHEDVINGVGGAGSQSHQTDPNGVVGTGVEGDRGQSPLTGGESLVGDVTVTAGILDPQVGVAGVLGVSPNSVVGVGSHVDFLIHDVVSTVTGTLQSVTTVATLNDLDGGRTPQVGPRAGLTGLEVTVVDVAVEGRILNFQQGHTVNVQLLSSGVGTGAAEVQIELIADSGEGDGLLGPIGRREPDAGSQSSTLPVLIQELNVGTTGNSLGPEGQLVVLAGLHVKGTLHHAVPVLSAVQVGTIGTVMGSGSVNLGVLVQAPVGAVTSLEVAVLAQRLLGQTLRDDHVVYIQVVSATAVTLEFEQDRTGSEGDAISGQGDNHFLPLGGDVEGGAVPVGTPVTVLDGDTHGAVGRTLSHHGDGVVLVGVHVLNHHVVGGPAATESPFVAVAAIGAFSDNFAYVELLLAVVPVQADNHITISGENAHGDDGAQHQNSSQHGNNLAHFHCFSSLREFRGMLLRGIDATHACVGSRVGKNRSTEKSVHPFAVERISPTVMYDDY